MSDRRPATYVYCVTCARTAPACGRGSATLPGAGSPRALHVVDDLWLVVASAPLATYGADSIEPRLKDLDWVSRCAIAHEAVVERAARAGPVVPMKLFTLFSSDERARAHVARSRKKLERLLGYVAGREEWGIRVSLDERRAVGRRTAGARRAPAPSGTGFLLRRKAERDAARLAVEDAVREGEEIFSQLAGRAVDARRRTPVRGDGGTRVVLDAAFLVPAREARRFRATATRLAKQHGRDGLDLTLTGPWPPYNFVSGSA